MYNSDSQPAFGAYKLSPFRDKLRAMSEPWRKSNRLVSSALRKISIAGTSEPYDVEPAAGFNVRLCPSDNLTDKKVFVGLEIEDTRLIEAMRRIAKECSQEQFNILDLGANSGMYAIASVEAARRVGLPYRLVAVEPNPAMAKRLRFNLKASGITDAQIFETAVSQSDGEVYLSLPRRNLGQATIIDDPDLAETITVPTRPLESVLDDAEMQRIDFLKIDIEGHEVTALRPYFESVSKDRYPRHILIEIKHDKDNSIDDLLCSVGYTMSENMISGAVYVHAGAQ